MFSLLFTINSALITYLPLCLTFTTSHLGTEIPMLISAWQIVDAQDFPDGSLVKNPPAMQETQESWVTSLGWEDTLEEEMATQSGILAWKSP